MHLLRDIQSSEILFMPTQQHHVEAEFERQLYLLRRPPTILRRLRQALSLPLQRRLAAKAQYAVFLMDYLGQHPRHPSILLYFLFRLDLVDLLHQ